MDRQSRTLDCAREERVQDAAEKANHDSRQHRDHEAAPCSQVLTPRRPQKEQRAPVGVVIAIIRNQRIGGSVVAGAHERISLGVPSP